AAPAQRLSLSGPFPAARQLRLVALLSSGCHRQRPIVRAMNKPFRIWMSGCMAVVLSSVALAADDTDGRRRVLQSSPYSVMETVHRLEAAAQRHGLPVFARVAQRAGPLAAAPAEAQVLVLASSIGG